MASTKYTYLIAAFPNQKVDSSRLTREIQTSPIVTALDYIDTSSLGADIWFKDALSIGDAAILDGIIAAHSGAPLPTVGTVVTTARTGGDGSPIVSAKKPDSPKVTLITPNWCDKTTWYPDSVYVEDEVALDSGDHTTYGLAHENLIDTYHGKITFEDALRDALNHSYRVVVKVNNVVKTEQDPHLGAGGDYTVDYAAGEVTFLAALQPADVVKVTHHYAQGSTAILAPTPGKLLILSSVELQFSEDIVMNDTVIFQAYGFVEVFAPQLMVPPYNIPAGTKIPLGGPLVYKTLVDLLNDSNKAYPAYPALGGNNWRAMKQKVYIFSWDYLVGSTILYASQGLEIRIKMEHETVCGGSLAVAACYCTSDDETP